MHFPFYLPLGPLHVSFHFIFEMLAYTVGFLFYRRLRARVGDPIPDGARWTVIAAAAAGAALGARLLNGLTAPPQDLLHWHTAAPYFAGKTIVGALIGGLAAVELTKRFIGEKHSTGDLFAAPLALGIAIGRVGCFFEGLPDQTYGIATSLPWGVDFGDGIRRHPTQLYESLFALLLLAFLFKMLRSPHRDGEVFKAFMVAYMGWRLAIDFLKPYPPWYGIGGIQWACLCMLLYYSPDISRWLLARQRAPESL
ncbi:MAG: prolipoprotein diacylglyceryl transferase family protein [Candidatus Acidiferrales bacterium]